MTNLLFFPLFYLLIRLGIIKSRSRLLLAAIRWANEESMQIIELDKIKYLTWHQGPGKIWFKVKSKTEQTYEICLELRIKNIQSLAQILRDGDAAYETKLVSKEHI